MELQKGEAWKIFGALDEAPCLHLSWNCLHPQVPFLEVSPLRLCWPILLTFASHLPALLAFYYPLARCYIGVGWEPDWGALGDSGGCPG